MSNQTQQPRWRPQSYPSQAWTEQSMRNAPNPRNEADEQLQLPTTIRAVRDSGAQASPARTLVICLDGTGDKFDNDNSNVVNFVACLKKDNPHQVTYYQSGIGTYSSSGLKSGISAAIDMAIGSDLGIHITGAYRFLMANYREGDKICLLGFSRGAYTVRCLAGMLHKVGLLPAHNTAQVRFAYKFYKDDTPQGWAMSAEFKRTFCMNVNVYFVGVWDCVAAVGVLPRRLPFGKSPTNSIRHFRHAMALDEHRAKFKHAQYLHDDPAKKQREEKAVPLKAEVVDKKTKEVGRVRRGFRSCFGVLPTPSVMKADSNPSNSSTTLVGKKEDKKEEKQVKLEKQFEEADHDTHVHVQTDVKEVWFAGCHADVGGGAVANTERHVLSRIPLRWMIRQCFECETGILFNTAALAEIAIDVHTIWPVYKKLQKPICGPSPGAMELYEAGIVPPLRRRSTALGIETKKQEQDAAEEAAIRKEMLAEAKRNHFILPEHVEDHFDAMAPINDQLEQAKTWWLLEFWPVKVRVQQKQEEEWKKVVRMNLGRFRAVREVEPCMHWTVEKRMQEKGYRIRNNVDKEAEWQVGL